MFKIWKYPQKVTVARIKIVAVLIMPTIHSDWQNKILFFFTSVNSLTKLNFPSCMYFPLTLPAIKYDLIT